MLDESCKSPPAGNPMQLPQRHSSRMSWAIARPATRRIALVVLYVRGSGLRGIVDFGRNKKTPESLNPKPQAPTLHHEERLLRCHKQ